MKDFYVADLPNRTAEKIISFFVVVSAQRRSKKNGDPYMAFVLADRTGRIDAKLWDDVELARSIAMDDYVKLEGRLSEYQGKPELMIQRMRTAELAEVDPTDFLPWTTFDIDRLWGELAVHINSVNNQEIRELLFAVIQNADVNSLLRLAPAATKIHHAYLGGLLEHTISLCRLVSLVVQNYTWINTDLLLAGAILHDLGKIEELAYERSIRYSDAGRLTGHIAIGLRIVRSVMATIGPISAGVALALEHMILSHHGELEHGSPVLPVLPEAILLHLLDSIDAKMAAVSAALGQNPSGAWTDRIAGLDRQVLRTQSLLEGD